MRPAPNPELRRRQPYPRDLSALPRGSTLRIGRAVLPTALGTFLRGARRLELPHHLAEIGDLGEGKVLRLGRFAAAVDPEGADAERLADGHVERLARGDMHDLARRHAQHGV